MTPMRHPEPHWREAGCGPGVVCLHANASNSSQWRGLMDRLAPCFHVLSPDSFGAGRSPAWLSGRPLRLQDEVALLAPVFERAGERFAVVGHSYGAALALIATLRHPQRVRCLALYEPTLFALLDAHRPPPNGADAIRRLAAAVAADLALGHHRSAARRFIDFWMGIGAWQGMPRERQDGIEATIVNARDWAAALFEDPTPLSALAALDVPTLLMIGRDSPAASREVAALLAATLRQVQVIEFEGMGHMGPITHPDLVDECIENFLRSRMATFVDAGPTSPT